MFEQKMSQKADGAIVYTLRSGDRPAHCYQRFWGDKEERTNTENESESSEQPFFFKKLGENREKLQTKQI